MPRLFFEALHGVSSLVIFLKRTCSSSGAGRRLCGVNMLPLAHAVIPVVLCCANAHTGQSQKQRAKLRISSCLSGNNNVLCRLGLRWPPMPQNAKRAGRPSFVRLWVLALEQAIRDGHLPEHVESAMPSWWRPGMPVWRSEPNAASDMADVPCVGEDGELRAIPKKRARRHESSPAVKEWFCNLTACHPDWNVAECIRYAKRLAPELFQVHIQTPRKWLRSGHTHVRPAVLGPAHVTELVDLGQRISEGISCGSSVFRFAFNQRLEALGCTYRFGPRECRRFLRQGTSNDASQRVKRGSGPTRMCASIVS